MKFKVIILFILFFFTAGISLSQSWVQLNVPYSFNINSCWADESNPDNGWFVGWRLAGADPVSFGYRTTNGGSSFNFSYFSYSFWMAQDVEFVNSTTGIAAGNGIIKTYNGGSTWNVILDNTYIRGSLKDIMFTDVNKGYAVGEAYDYSYSSFWGVLYKTTTGGENWTEIIITDEIANQNTDLKAVFSTGNGILYAGGSNTVSSNTLYKSTDDGANWFALSYFNDVNSIYFITPQIGFVAGSQGVFKTTDAGLTWQNSLSTSGAMHTITFKNNTGYTGGVNGEIYKTTNNGVSWSLMVSPVNNQVIKKIYIVNNTVSYAVGTGGTVLKLSGNLTGTGNNSSLPSSFKLDQNFPNPFNPSTDIRFSVPVQSLVRITLYDIQGKEVADIVNETKPAGNYSVRFDGSNLASGVYLCRMTSGSFSDIKKLSLVK